MCCFVRKQLLSREEDLRQKISSHTIVTSLSPSPLSSSPLSHPPYHTNSLPTAASHPSPLVNPPKSPLPTPHISISSSQMTQSLTSHTSDQTWEMNNDDIIDSLSEDEDEFLLPMDQLLDSVMAREKREGGERGGDSTLTAESEVIEIQPSPPLGNTQKSNPPKAAPFKPPFSSAESRPSCSSFRPSQGAMPDNASEFQGQYPHTQEMMKIFTQV